MSETLALRCPKCERIFFIMRSECQKELMCPRNCGVVAEYVRCKEELLFELLKGIVGGDGKSNGSKGGS